MGKIRAPYYRIVVADSRTKRDGRVIEEIGKYHPKENPSVIEVDSDRALYWLGVGAQPSEPVTAILKVTGDWQKFKGEPAPPPMLVAEERRDKAARFNDALKDSRFEPSAEAVTPRRAKRAESDSEARAAATDSSDVSDAGAPAEPAVGGESEGATDAAPSASDGTESSDEQAEA
jgi:small subunit ribosomal protein S16